MKREQLTMSVTLSSAGNPDHGQYSGRNVLSPSLSVQVKDFAHASKICRAYIARYALGAGNWTGGSIRQGKKTVGRISYNGRVWPV
jgi:hypothetical protein